MVIWCRINEMLMSLAGEVGLSRGYCCPSNPQTDSLGRSLSASRLRERCYLYPCPLSPIRGRYVDGCPAGHVLLRVPVCLCVCLGEC